MKMNTFNFTDKNGNDLINLITNQNKFNIVIKSKPYNYKGAYYPFESRYIDNNDNLYNILTKNNISLKLSYIDYYNNIKSNIEKNTFSMPSNITINDIENITITLLEPNYTNYAMR